MRLIGCDLHASQQSIAMLDRDTGVVVKKTLTHEGSAVREFYASIPAPVVVGIEATGSMGWFLRLMEELESLPLPPHTAHRRSELQALYRHLEEHIDRLDERVQHVANERARATLLMTHPGVGPVTALATEAIRARCPLSRAGKEIILTMTRPMSGSTQSFPRTWMTPRCASASIPRRSIRLLRRRRMQSGATSPAIESGPAEHRSIRPTGGRSVRNAAVQ
jgi:hypothetical protein